MLSKLFPILGNAYGFSLVFSFFLFFLPLFPGLEEKKKQLHIMSRTVFKIGIIIIVFGFIFTGIDVVVEIAKNRNDLSLEQMVRVTYLLVWIILFDKIFSFLIYAVDSLIKSIEKDIRCFK